MIRQILRPAVARLHVPARDADGDRLGGGGVGKARDVGDQLVWVDGGVGAGGDDARHDPGGLVASACDTHHACPVGDLRVGVQMCGEAAVGAFEVLDGEAPVKRSTT